MFPEVQLKVEQRVFPVVQLKEEQRILLRRLWGEEIFSGN